MLTKGSYLRTSLRICLLASLLTALVTGPNLQVGPLGLGLFDFVFVITILLFTSVFINGDLTKFPVARNFSLWFAAVLYFGLAFFLPIAGYVIYNYPVGYIVGDLRWLQISSIGFIMIVFYNKHHIDLIREFKIIIKITILFNLIFFLLQYLHWSGLADTSNLLEMWYFNRGRMGDYGHHIGRFSGGHSQSSTLGFSSVIAIAVFSYTFIEKRQNGFFLVLAAFLLLASGHRTSMIAVVGIVSLYCARFVISQNLRFYSPTRVLSTIIIFSTILPVLYHFNIGRIRTSDRYRELLDILTGAGVAEISGRADRWGPAIDRASEYPLGTLANPAWVLDVPTIDSYYVLAYAQGGLLLLISYLLLLTIMGVYSLRLLSSDSRALIPIFFIIIIGTQSLMQNFMTSISAKLILVLTFIFILQLLLDNMGTSVSDV